jgi:hypothetical protein
MGKGFVLNTFHIYCKTACFKKGRIEVISFGLCPVKRATAIEPLAVRETSVTMLRNDGEKRTRNSEDYNRAIEE